MISEEQIQEKYEDLKRKASIDGLKNKTDRELLLIARELVEADDPDLQPTFLKDVKEKRKAKELTRRYIKEYLIETFADKQLVKHLVYLEVMQGRLQDQLNDLHKDDKIVPIQMLEILQKNLKAITDARSTLGLNRDKHKQDTSDTLGALTLLKVKFRKWNAENQGSRTFKCPCCGEMILLKIRMEAWEAQRHPHFVDRILGNKHLMKLYGRGTVNQEDVALILGTSPEYCAWLVEKWNVKLVPDGGVNAGTETP